MEHLIRKCPVCRIALLIRADVRTCSDQCSKEWRQFSWAEKQKRLSPEYDEQVLTPEQIEDWAKTVSKGEEEAEEVIESILKKEDL